jgi:DNA polymerase-3 subunit alpha (Gram-positive type)
MEEKKTFSEVFPDFRTGERLAGITKKLWVDRVALNKKRGLVRVYVSGETCVEKKDVYELEKSIKSQLFSDVPLKVAIIEHFHLSSLYTPKALIEVYKESIELELEQHSRILAYLFHSAQFSYPDEETIVLSLEDTAIAHAQENVLYEAVEQILNERCALNVKLEIDYHDAMEQSRLEKSEAMMRAAAARVASRVSGLAAGKDESFAQEGEIAVGTSEGTAAKEAERASGGASAGEKKEKGKKSGAFGGAGKGQSGFRSGRRSFVHTDPKDPDQLYGRNFEGDSTPIADLDEFSGMVVIRGQIIGERAEPSATGEASSFSPSQTIPIRSASNASSPRMRFRRLSRKLGKRYIHPRAGQGGGRFL